VRPLDLKHGRVDMTPRRGRAGHGAADRRNCSPGTWATNTWQGNDGAVLPAPTINGRPGRLVMATDSHVVSPLFFPGGDIGCLSVHGTVNDVAMMGATPLYLAAGFILEEGFPLADLARIVESMAAAAREAGVPVVTGDTKVVEQGKGDGVFITTTGVGVLPTASNSGRRARPGDVILVSGTLGDHGVAIMSQAREPELRAPSNPTPRRCNGLVAAMLATAPACAACATRRAAAWRPRSTRSPASPASA
jgi:hydrogenase expression/formation protein HypE